MEKRELMEKYSKEMIKNFPPINKIFTSYISQFNDEEFFNTLPSEVTFSYLMSEKGISMECCENILVEKKEFDMSYKKLMEKEAAEFGVPFDLDDAKHQWSNSDEAIQEACVQRIEEIYKGREHEIIFYGPSNIQMWYSLENDMLPYKAQNHGMGGCIDSEMIKYADRMLYAFKPTVVFFQTGSNDLATGIPIEQILENKKAMYGQFLENMPHTKLVVMSGLPLPGRMSLWPATEKTNELLKQLCEENERMYFMDATDCFMKESGDEAFKSETGKYFCPEYYRADRIHLNKKGHDLWTEKMKFVLEVLV